MMSLRLEFLKLRAKVSLLNNSSDWEGALPSRFRMLACYGSWVIIIVFIGTSGPCRGACSVIVYYEELI